MRISLTLLTLSLLTVTKAQVNEEQSIRAQIVKFSQYMMNDQRSELVKLYTTDAKIFPTGTDILEGDDLLNYWNPKGERKWKTTYHKVSPIEIKVLGDEAYDYGYYEGTSTNGANSSNWKGKYVIIWRKENSEWKIYLDIWNRIENE